MKKLGSIPLEEAIAELRTTGFDRGFTMPPQRQIVVSPTEYEKWKRGENCMARQLYGPIENYEN